MVLGRSYDSGRSGIFRDAVFQGDGRIGPPIGYVDERSILEKYKSILEDWNFPEMVIF